MLQPFLDLKRTQCPWSEYFYFSNFLYLLFLTQTHVTTNSTLLLHTAYTGILSSYTSNFIFDYKPDFKLLLLLLVISISSSDIIIGSTPVSCLCVLLDVLGC